MSKKEKLIQSLSTVILALENDTVLYNWEQQTQCNCGLVAQVLLGKNQYELKHEIKKQELFNKKILKEAIGSENGTWRNAVKAYCPISQRPLKQIFIDLENAGLSKDDISHLEYMNNQVIFAKSGIEKTKKYKKSVNVGTKKIPVNTFFGKLFGITKSEPIYETKEFEEKYDWFANKENLIKYLKAWVLILKDEKESVDFDDIDAYSKNDLNERLLVAVADEDYSLAARLRDEINK
jgi:hypothetical protein